VGQRRADQRNRAGRAVYARLFRDSAAREGLPIQLEAGTNTLAAGGLTEIGHRGGNLEWAIHSFCSALSVLWVTGSLLALARPAPRVVLVGRTLNLTALSLPNTCGVRGPEAGGKAIQGDIARSGRLLTARISDRVCIL
jgi:hypothetical protein